MFQKKKKKKKKKTAVFIWYDILKSKIPSDEMAEAIDIIRLITGACLPSCRVSKHLFTQQSLTLKSLFLIV